MTEASSPLTSSSAPPSRISGAALLTVGGLAAAFGVAAWLGGIASLAAPNRTLLLVFAALALAAAAILLWRQQRHAATCGPNGVCTPPAARVLTLVGLIIGVVLLVAGYFYV